MPIYQKPMQCDLCPPPVPTALFSTSYYTIPTYPSWYLLVICLYNHLYIHLPRGPHSRDNSPYPVWFIPYTLNNRVFHSYSWKPSSIETLWLKKEAGGSRQARCCVADPYTPGSMLIAPRRSQIPRIQYARRAECYLILRASFPLGQLRRGFSFYHHVMNISIKWVWKVLAPRPSAPVRFSRPLTDNPIVTNGKLGSLGKMLFTHE